MPQTTGLTCWYSFVTFGHKIKIVDVFGVIRWKGEIDFLMGKFLEAFYFPSVLLFVANCFETFLSIFISNYVFPVIGIEIHYMQINIFKVKVSIT